MKNWRDISYLEFGTRRQQAALRTLQELSILERLKHFDPVLVSTVNLNIDIPESDLDIICEVRDAAAFTACCQQYFAGFSEFTSRESHFENFLAVVVSFQTELFEIEIFGAPIPVEQQPAYRHLVTFHRVLEICGEPLRIVVQKLKEAGLKTEPAFAEIFGLAGNPYEEVYSLDNMDEGALVQSFKEYTRDLLVE
ncbi:MAG: DUF4269 domain-containing protein [Bdellovibrionales bacterium]|nr:DUF4269 domain-containing protein [Bdellovibrionales bacterium]